MLAFVLAYGKFPGRRLGIAVFSTLLSVPTVVIGLTDHAQTQLGDIVFVNLPLEGDAVTEGDAFADHVTLSR